MRGPRRRVGFYDHTLDLQTKGKQVESVVQFAQAPGEVEVVSTKAEGDITSAKDFKGKKLGVTGLGSITDFLTKYLAVQGGLKVSDVAPVAVGAGQTLTAALQQGSIQAGMTTAAVEKVLKAFNPDLQHATMDLEKTYTSEFVKNVK